MALCIIPARLGSTRLQRKMLLEETGLPLFQHTVENAQRSRVFERVLLATDSHEIAERARSAGIQACMTRESHVSGTDRVNEAYRWLCASTGAEWAVVVNLQGDEPEVEARDFDALVAAFADPQVQLATLACRLPSEHLGDPALVKVVLDERDDALYFSRAPIPFAAHGASAAGALRHIGVYGFRPEALARFCALPTGKLEACEKLEQLRWLEHGGRIRVVRTQATETGPTGIDTAEEYAAFCTRERARRARGPGKHKP